MNNVNLKIAEDLNKRILNSNSILIISSRPADEDSVGSALVLNWWIKEFYKKDSKTVIFGSLTDRLNSLPDSERVEFTRISDINFDDYDLVICLDGNSWERVFTSSAYKSILNKIDLSKFYSIDHHIGDAVKEDLGDRCLQDKEACTVKIIFDYLIEPSGIKIPPHVATWIDFALVDDTGRFKHELYPDTFKFADKIYNLGAEHKLATDENTSLESIKFLSWGITHTNFYEDIESTVLTITPLLHEEANSRFGNNWERKIIFQYYKEVVQRKIYGFNYGVLFQQDRYNHGVRGGWRTRTYGEHVSLQKVFEEMGFNAGGHFGAGGLFSAEHDINTIEEEFVAKMKAVLNNKELYLE